MHSNPAIRNLIREEKTYQIDSVIASHSAEGMRTMDQSLFALAQSGRITAETALRFSVHEEALTRRLEAEHLL
jgi:twitching motility protein PilT